MQVSWRLNRSPVNNVDARYDCSYLHANRRVVYSKAKIPGSDRRPDAYNHPRDSLPKLQSRLRRNLQIAHFRGPLGLAEASNADNRP